MTLSAGTRLGPYEVLAPLGAGGMGEVYRARDIRLDRSVAVKVLPSHLTHDPERRTRFEREAKAVSSLNHPHICTLYDVGHEEGTDYLVMELVVGQPLAERLKKGPLPLAQALEVGTQIADALAAAHGHGIVHRDLKPGNVMLTKMGVKLLDLGLARLSERRELFIVPPDSEGMRQMMVTDVRPGLALTFGRPRRLFGFSPPALSFECAPNRCYAVAPDGERFYVRQMPPTAPPAPVTHVQLVQNWTEELKARVPGGTGR